MHSEYEKICKELGHKIKIFTQMKARFSKAIGSPDAVVIFTNTVSHKMVKVASVEAKKRNILIVRCHTSSRYALENTIKHIENIKAV